MTSITYEGCAKAVTRIVINRLKPSE